MPGRIGDSGRLGCLVLCAILGWLTSACFAVPDSAGAGRTPITASPSPSAPAPAVSPIPSPPVIPTSTPERVPVAGPSPLSLTEAAAIRDYFSQPFSGVDLLTVQRIDRLSPFRPAPDDQRRVYLVSLRVQPAEGAATDWQAGENLRWVELLREPGQDWQIGQVSATPLPPAG